MKRNWRITAVILLATALLGLGLLYWGLPAAARFLQGSAEKPAVGYPAETVRAEVIKVISEGRQNGRDYQLLLVEIVEGPYQGTRMDVELGGPQMSVEGDWAQPGETILVMVSQRIDTGVVRAHFVDYERSGPLLWLFAAFVAASVLISGWKGLRSLIGILFSLAMIILFVIPQILAGKDPVLVSILGSFVFLSVTMYLIYGWTLKTHSAVLGILLALLITGLLAVIFIHFTRLTGFGDENAMFLVQQTPEGFNMRGLLLAGMLIGSLGVLDDLVISQASAVFELHAANSQLSLPFLYRRAMNIGRDHVASTVNTLVLAYAGSSLPMLLLFSINSGNYAMLANMSMVAEEIVRTLVGSIGLFLSVPLTTFLACLFVLYQERFGRLRPFLGPENQWDAHSAHFH